MQKGSRPYQNDHYADARSAGTRYPTRKAQAASQANLRLPMASATTSPPGTAPIAPSRLSTNIVLANCVTGEGQAKPSQISGAADVRTCERSPTNGQAEPLGKPPGQIKNIPIRKLTAILNKSWRCLYAATESFNRHWSLTVASQAAD